MEKLDLHGMRHHLAEATVIRKVEEFWDTNTEIEIITGNSTGMKEIVKRVLVEYGLEYREGDVVNAGYIKVTV